MLGNPGMGTGNPINHLFCFRAAEESRGQAAQQVQQYSSAQHRVVLGIIVDGIVAPRIPFVT